MDVFERYLTCPGKTHPRISLFEHSLHVLQVANFLIRENSANIQHPQLIRAGALCHDVGKLAADFRSGKWIHTPHTSEFLPQLLDDARFGELLTLADAVPSQADRELLLSTCETHHFHSPDLLRRCKDVILIPVADALASALESGLVGNIAGILRMSPYLQVSFELVRSLGFTNGFEAEIHHIDLPHQFVEDLFLADMVFRVLAQQLGEVSVAPVLQMGASLWVAGRLDTIHKLLATFTVDPKQLYDSVFEELIYDSILSELPPVGSMQIDSLKYILVNEPIARKLAIAVFTRKSVRSVLERYDLSHVADESDRLFADGLLRGIEKVWNPIRAKLLQLLPELDLPESVTKDIPQAADGSLERFRIGIYAKARANGGGGERLSKRAANNRRILAQAEAKVGSDISELLKLFDASGNYNRSVTNVALEFLKMQADITAGTYSLPVAQVASLDVRTFVTGSAVRNSALCPVCRRFPQEIKAQGLITGNPKMDSVFQTFRKARGQISVCRWCFLAGYMDLPIASISRDGQAITKDREYLLLTSPMPKDKLQWLVDFVRSGRKDAITDGEQEESGPDRAEIAELEAMMGLAVGYDQLAVLGVSRKRLSNLKGFVLPTSNALGNLVGIRIPVERLVGEDKVSGAVRRELLKATMYDLHLATGAPSMHYNVVTDAAFSVSGREVDLEEMRRASAAYRIANRYARVGRYRQLNSGLFMLLLSDARHAVTLILRSRKRDNHGKYAPGEDRIKEIIQMAESIAQRDWKFDLGQRITSVLVEVDLLPKARGFWKSREEKFSGVELTKWLRRIKVAHDESSARQWGTQLINALKSGRVASRELKEAQGIEIRPPGEETITRILAMIEDIITECRNHRCKISEFSRDVAEMDYYLLFYYNQKAKETKP